MQSRWNDADAAACLEQYAGAWGEDLAQCVYASRLLGADPKLVVALEKNLEALASR